MSKLKISIASLLCVTLSSVASADNTYPDPYQNLKFYYGDNHFHSGFSGDNTKDGHPIDAFMKAIEHIKTYGQNPAMGGDASSELGGYFLFMSDHMQFVPTRRDMTNDTYKIMLKEANDSRADMTGPDFTFTAFPGGEMTGVARKGQLQWDDKFGHMNLFMLPDIGSFTENDLLSNQKGTVIMDKMTKVAGAIGQFNHSGYNNEPRTGDNADSLYAYTPERAKVYKFFEVTDGANPDYWAAGSAQYNVCLQQGYQVSPVVGSDIHNTQQALLFKTTPETRLGRTVIIAPSTVNMTVEQRRKVLLNAVQQGRVYATENLGLHLKFSLNGFPIGHTFTTIPDQLDFSVNVSSADKIQSVQLLQNQTCMKDGKRIAPKDVTSESQCTKVIANWQPKDTTQFQTSVSMKKDQLDSLKYIYLKVVMQNGERAMTTPLFFSQNPIFPENS